MSPTKAQMQSVIDRLTEYDQLCCRDDYPPTVSFEDAQIWRDGDPDDDPGGCGTVACFAGHYAAAVIRLSDDLEWVWADSGDQRGELLCRMQNGCRLDVGYEAGCDMIAEALGFPFAERLCIWASRHPEIWGNEHGASMFSESGALAFGAPRTVWGDVRLTLSMGAVLGHLEGVRDRLPA